MLYLRNELDLIILGIDQFKYLSELIQRPAETLSGKSVSQASKFFELFYTRLQEYSTENSSITPTECDRRLEQLKSLLPPKFVYCPENSVEYKFLDLSSFAFKVDYPCEPSLLKLPQVYMNNHHAKNFFEKLGVKQEFTLEMLVQKLTDLKLTNKDNPLDERSMTFCIKVIEELTRKRNLQNYLKKCTRNDELFIPDCDNIMRKLEKLYSIEDDNMSGFRRNSANMMLDPELDLHLVHPDVNPMKLGIKDIKSKVINKIGRPFGQKESLVNRIKDILTRYSAQFCLFKVSSGGNFKNKLINFEIFK